METFVSMQEEREQLATALYEAKCLLFGKFTLSSGVTINAYMDLITLLSHPKELNLMCDVAYKTIQDCKLKVQTVCGVSYSGIPFATLIANKLRAPLLMRNKEMSFCPTDARIVGNVHNKGEVLIIEEVVCSATSTLQVIKDVEDAGMIVKHVLVMIDLEQGGETNLSKLGYKLHSVLKLSEMASILHNRGLLNNKHMEDVRIGWKEEFAPNGDCITDTILEKRKAQTYESRAPLMKSEISKKLLEIISEKRSNLCVTLNTNNVDTLLKVANEIGPYICILGVHLDAFNVDDLSINRINELQRISRSCGFLLFDDRKISETGDELSTYLQKILKWVDLVSVLPLEGEMTMTRINEVSASMPEKGIIFVGSSFTQDSLIKSNFERKMIKLALEKCPSLMGFVAHQNSDIPLPYVHLMQDIKTTSKVTNFNSYNSYYNEDVITQNMAADVVMVSVGCDDLTIDYVKQKQHSSWLGYENRFMN